MFMLYDNDLLKHTSTIIIILLDTAMAHVLPV